MPKRKTSTRWKAILDLCDELIALKERHDEGEEVPAVRARLRASMKIAVSEIGKKMSRERRSGILSFSSQLDLKNHDLVVIALLLSRHVSSTAPFIEGREILDLLFDGSYAKLQGMKILESKGELRSTGLVEVDLLEKASDPLDIRFHLSEKIVRLFCDAGIVPQRTVRLRPQKVYRNNREYLLDLKALKALFRHRSLRIFDPERFALTEGGVETLTIDKRIQAVRRRIAETLEATPNIGEFAAIRFRHEFGLTEEEMLIVVGLLFQELLEGEAYADAVDLLKMISSDEEDLMRKRKLFRVGSSLLRHNIVQLEDMVAEKEMTAEVVLSNWVVERLLGEEKSESAIAPDEKIDFHNYLKNLDSADKFFRDLTKESES